MVWSGERGRSLESVGALKKALIPFWSQCFCESVCSSLPLVSLDVSRRRIRRKSSGHGAASALVVNRNLFDRVETRSPTSCPRSSRHSTQSTCGRLYGGEITAYFGSSAQEGPLVPQSSVDRRLHFEFPREPLQMCEMALGGDRHVQ